jgi:tetratricopeptide (TPR) repeat protein
MTRAEWFQRVVVRAGFLPLAATLLLALRGSAWSLEPMIDESVMDSSRVKALNLIKESKFSDSIQAEEQALKIAEEKNGPLHPSLAPLYNNLGTLYRCLGDYGKAEQNYKWALALLEKNFGPRHPRVIGTLENLAALYNDLGRFEEAGFEAEKALSIREANAFQDPQNLAHTQGLLGQIETSLQNYSQAQTLFQKALKNLKNDSNADSGVSITFLNSLAQAYQSEQDDSQAQTCLEKSLDIARKNFPDDAIEVADAMERLADFFHSRGLDEKAKPLYASALKIDQRYVGTVYSYESLPYLKRLAKAFFTVGDAKSSEALWQKSLQTEEKIFGPRHPQTALDLSQLAQVEWALKEKSKARKDLKESIDILKSDFSDNHPLVVQVQTQLEKLEK